MTEQSPKVRRRPQGHAEQATETQVQPVAPAPAPEAKTEQAPKAAKPIPTPAEALAAARAADPARWELVEAVTEQTPKGEPKRVRIRCSDPQTRQGESVCRGHREIATQDLFQVRRCEACQDRVLKRARRERTKARLRKAKALLRASEQQ